MVEYGIGEYYYQAGDIIDFLKGCPLGNPVYMQNGIEERFIPIGNILETNVAIYLERGASMLTVRDLYNIIDPPSGVTDNLKTFAHEFKKGLFNLRGRFIPLHKSQRVLYLKISNNCYPVERYEMVSNGVVLYAAENAMEFKNAEHFAEVFLKQSY